MQKFLPEEIRLLALEEAVLQEKWHNLMSYFNGIQSYLFNDVNCLLDWRDSRQWYEFRHEVYYASEDKNVDWWHILFGARGRIKSEFDLLNDIII